MRFFDSVISIADQLLYCFDWGRGTMQSFFARAEKNAFFPWKFCSEQGVKKEAFGQGKNHFFGEPPFLTP